MKLPTITIVGTGSLGSTLAHALYNKGYPIKSLYNRRSRPAEELSGKLDARYTGAFPESGSELGKLIFITVPDGAIADAALSLSSLREDFSGSVIAHCSGNESSARLEPLKLKGAATAAFHPLQTFTARSSASDFSGIYFDLEGGTSARKTLRTVAGHLEAEVLEISPGQKPYLHAAAVFVSNYLVALLDAAEGTARKGRLDPEIVLRSMLPLMRQTLQNVQDGELSEALTGPITRGDSETVARHLKLLSGNAELTAAYKLLGRRAVKIARKKGSLPSKKATELRKMLKDDD